MTAEWERYVSLAELLALVPKWNVEQAEKDTVLRFLAVVAQEQYDAYAKVATVGDARG